MIKAISHITLSFLLLIATTGIAISKHYCGGELVSTSINSEAESCCDSGDCCKNETELVQLDTEFSVSPTMDLPESAQIDLIVFSLAIFNYVLEESTLSDELGFADLPPPQKIQKSLAIRQSYLL